MFERWNRWMHARDSAKMVKREDQDFLERRYLWALAWTKRLPERGLLHTFWMDDPDPLHDHPWDWGRVIVQGSYREHYIDGTFADCEPGHVVWRRQAQVLHRVELLTPSVTTIFWHWRRSRVWGFLHSDGWRPTPDEAQDGRKTVGWIFPRKIGEAPKEAVHS